MEETRKYEDNVMLVSEGLEIIDNTQCGVQEYYCGVCNVNLPFDVTSALQHCNGLKHLNTKKLEVGVAIAKGAIAIINKMHYCNLCNIDLGSGLNETLNHYRNKHMEGDTTTRIASTQIQTHETDTVVPPDIKSMAEESRSIHASEGVPVIEKSSGRIPVYGGNHRSKPIEVSADAIPPDITSKKIKIIGKRYFCEVCKIYLPMDVDLPQHINGRIHEMELLKSLGVITLVDRQSYCVICKTSIGFRYRAALNHYKNMHKKEYRKMLSSKQFQTEVDRELQPTSIKMNTTSVSAVRNVSGTPVIGSKDAPVTEKLPDNVCVQASKRPAENSASKDIKINAEIRPKGFKIVDNKYFCEVCKIYLPIDVDLLQHCYGRKHEMELLISQGAITIIDRKCQCEICKKNIGFGFRAALNHFRTLHKEEYRKMLASKELQAVNKFPPTNSNNEPALKKAKVNSDNTPTNPNCSNNTVPISSNVSNTSSNLGTSNNLNLSPSCSSANETSKDNNNPSSVHSHLSDRSAKNKSSGQREARVSRFDRSDCSDGSNHSVDLHTSRDSHRRRDRIDHRVDSHTSRDSHRRHDRSDHSVDLHKSRDSHRRHHSDHKEKRDKYYGTSKSKSNSHNISTHASSNKYVVVDSYSSTSTYGGEDNTVSNSVNISQNRTKNDDIRYDDRPANTDAQIKRDVDEGDDTKMQGDSILNNNESIKQEKEDEWLVSSSIGDDEVDNNCLMQGKIKHEEEGLNPSLDRDSNSYDSKNSGMDSKVSDEHHEEEKWVISYSYDMYY